MERAHSAITDRRRQILDGATALVVDTGLRALTMRSAADRAGVSLRLVQYYFGSKDGLLSATLDRFAANSFDRWRERANERGAESPTALIEAFVEEALPTDSRSGDFHRFGVAFADLALRDPEVAAAAYRRHLTMVQSTVSDLFAAAGRNTEDAQDRALKLMSLAHGMSTLVMVGHMDNRHARRLLRDEIHRV